MDLRTPAFIGDPASIRTLTSSPLRLLLLDPLCADLEFSRPNVQSLGLGLVLMPRVSVFVLVL